MHRSGLVTPLGYVVHLTVCAIAYHLQLGRSPGEEMATHSSILAWKIHGQRNLVGYSPWGRKESDTTERLHFTSWSGGFRDGEVGTQQGEE